MANIENNILKYCKEIPIEIRKVLNDAPSDDVDWALILYLFKHSDPLANKNNPKNPITIGKIASWFALTLVDVSNRLHRMRSWCSIYTIKNNEYSNSVDAVNITPIAVDTLMSLILNIEARKQKQKEITEQNQQKQQNQKQSKIKNK